MDIAICDDCHEDVESLKKIIEKYNLSVNGRWSVTFFDKG